MRNFALGAVGALLALSGVAAAGQCSEPCLENTNGTFLTCDDAVNEFNFTCQDLEVWHCCDCSGCCEETTTTTTIHPCDEPCQGAYSANNIVDMLGADPERCTAAVNDDLAPECDLTSCGCQSAECSVVQEGCGFSCGQLVNAGFTCEDTIDAGCANCTECGCSDETTETPVDACDAPCFEGFDVSCNFLIANTYTCDMAEELGCDCTGCGCELYEDVCDTQMYNVTVDGPLYSCHELCAPSGDAIRALPSVGNFSTLQLIRLGINCLQCDCIDTTSTTTTTTTSTTTTTTTTTTSTTFTTTTTTTTTTEFNITEGCAPGHLLESHGIPAPGGCLLFMLYEPYCDDILADVGIDCTNCGCLERTTTTTTTTTTTSTTTTVTTTTTTTSTTTSTTTTTNNCAPCLVSLRSDADFYTCEDLMSSGHFDGRHAPFGEFQNGLSDGSSWTCEYLEEEYGCDCSGCGCVEPEETTTPSCPATCSSPEDGVGVDFTCDETLDVLNYDKTCADLEADHGCDCVGCACMEGYCSSKNLGFSVSIDVNGTETFFLATCDLLNEQRDCASLHRGEHDLLGIFSYQEHCIDHGCGCDECVPGCLGDNTCDDWLLVNGVAGSLSCDDLEASPYGCDCSGCECRQPELPCSAQCGPPSGDHDGLQAFADEQGIVSCDDWGAFFTEETFTCAYLEHEWDCDCSGCACETEPMCQTAVECKVCNTDVFSGNCDEIYEMSDFHLSCDIAEATFGCDCVGCACATEPPVSNETCPVGCLGYTCDEVLPVFGGDLSCSSLESLGFDCGGCTGCEFYDICDTYRSGFSAGFIANAPDLVAYECDGSPIRVQSAFSFCDCANLCEVTDGCAHFDNKGLDCRLFAEEECTAPTASGDVVGVWNKKS